MIVDLLLGGGALLLLVVGVASFLYSTGGPRPVEEWRPDGAPTSARRRPWRLERDVYGSGLPLQPASLVILVAMLAALSFFVTLEIKPGAYLIAAAVALALGYLPLLLVRDLAERRAKKFEAHLADAIDIMVAALEAGENPVQSMRHGARGGRKIVARELGEIASRLDLSLPIQAATSRAVQRFDSEGVRLFVSALIAKWYVGGELAPLLKSVNLIIRERVKLRMRLSGQLAGARYTSVLVAVLPYLMLPVFMAQHPSWIEILAQHPLGPTLVGVGIVLQVIGFLWLRRVLRFDP